MIPCSLGPNIYIYEKAEKNKADVSLASFTQAMKTKSKGNKFNQAAELSSVPNLLH